MPALTAKIYHSGFSLAHDSYNGIAATSDGNIYYVLSSQEYHTGAQLYRYDPKRDSITHCGDLTEACGEREMKTIVQGKCHTVPVESNGKLYFGTHCGYYEIIEGTERIGRPPIGYRPYPGGHFLAYDLANGRFEDLGIAPFQQAILSAAMDTKRGLLYGLSWPDALFLVCDAGVGKVRSFGPVQTGNESGAGEYGTICRSMAVDPDDGSVYLTNPRGDILSFRLDKQKLEMIEGEDMRKDYFGQYCPAAPGHMGYHWRQTFWHPGEEVIYGIHGNSGYLFRFDPRACHIEVLQRLTSEPSQRSGMFDQFSYGYLGFALSPDRRTIWYLTGGPVYHHGKRVSGKLSTAKGESKGVENVHLVTYDIPHGRYVDHGPITLDNGNRPSYVNSLAVATERTAYAMSRLSEDGITDLIGFHPARAMA